MDNKKKVRLLADIKITKTSKNGLKEGEFEAQVTNDKMNRNGYRFDMEGLDISRVKKGMPLTWIHDYFSLPLGRVQDLWFEGKKLMGKFVIDLVNQFEREVYEKVKLGTLNMVSMGSFADEVNDDETIIKKATAYEVALVVIGANDNAYVTKNSLEAPLGIEKKVYAEFVQKALAKKFGGLKEDQVDKYIDTLKNLTSALEAQYQEASVDTDNAKVVDGRVAVKKLVLARSTAKQLDKCSENIISNINYKIKLKNNE